MLKKLLTGKDQPLAVEAGGSSALHYKDSVFTLDNRPLLTRSAGAHLLEPFLEERRRLKKPLQAARQGDRLEVTLEREKPARRYTLTIHPNRRMVEWTEELSQPLDTRLPSLAPTWSRSFAHPPWPARTGHTSLSAAWLPDGVLLLLGDWLTWMDPDTGKVRGEWPLPGKPGTRAAVELLALVEQGILGSYRVFEGQRPAVSGLLLLRLEDQPRWRLIPTRASSVHVDAPVQSSAQQLVVETRVYAGEDYLASRAQWVVDLASNQSYTALVGGLPQDEGVERCLSLLPELPNRLEFVPLGGKLVGTHPYNKLSALLPLEQRESDGIFRGALWKGRALAYELGKESMHLYAWEADNLDLARCRACRQPVPLRAYHCPCGLPFQP